MFIIDLSKELCIIQVQGTDSKKFLQGQITNDINMLDNDPYQFAAHLNHKGRMLSTLIIHKLNETTYHLITTCDVAVKLTQTLKMYVLRAAVTISKVDDLTLVYSDIIVNCQYQLELLPNKFLSIIKVGEELADITISTDLWHHFLISRGIPFIYEQTYAQLIPQQVNFTQLGGVNFKKGCYTGQEIVARMHYLGKTKQKMFNFKCNGSVDIGQRVISPKIDNQEVGIIVDTVISANISVGLISIQADYMNDVFVQISEQMLQLNISELNN